jgi:hypothetical protein
MDGSLPRGLEVGMGHHSLRDGFEIFEPSLAIRDAGWRMRPRWVAHGPFVPISGIDRTSFIHYGVRRWGKKKALRKCEEPLREVDEAGAGNYKEVVLPLLIL